jgi:hypothetical protein
MPAEYEKMTEFGLVWTATLDGPESVGSNYILTTDLLGTATLIADLSVCSDANNMQGPKEHRMFITKNLHGL